MNRNIIENHKEYRPLLHFSAPKAWLNDPNGLIYDGENYHLFYQHYPFDIVPGPMHWGHSMSKDLIHWENKEIALYPTEKGVIFSGSAVIDHRNTAQFGTGAMVVMFTFHQEVKENGEARIIQSQGIAYSLDGGNSFVHYDKNPVLTYDNPDFRDPKVFWHEESTKWIAILVAGNKAMLYNSDNLKDWNFLSEFVAPNSETDGLWECPDLLQVQVEGSDEKKWVLIVSASTKDHERYGMQYFIGEFDGTRFINETHREDILFLDFTFDNYAAVTYEGVKDRSLMVGWMNCWHYGRTIPAKTFRGAMTIPREIMIYKEKGVFRLKQSLIREVHEQSELVSKDLNIQEISLSTSPLLIDMELDRVDNEILLSNSKHHIKIKVDVEQSKILIDRRGCGNESMGSAFYREYQDEYQYA
ncbi:MAG: glycoside hydrolase family 32 protein, partial [Vallitaleaceae bacterium]|nr:glycoside hydrolase family 32 protein [Vallitaleaceae bacterium]